MLTIVFGCNTLLSNVFITLVATYLYQIQLIYWYSGRKKFCEEQLSLEAKSSLVFQSLDETFFATGAFLYYSCAPYRFTG